MNRTIDRRVFLRSTGALAAGISLARWGGAPLAAAETAAPHAEQLGWQLAGQQYTFRRFTFYEAVEKTAALGIPAIESCFFLPLSKERGDLKTNADLSAEARQEARAKLAACGIQWASHYAELPNDEAAARKIYEFAQQMGVGTIVAEPAAEAFDMLDKLCEEFKLNLAIHNHPKSPASKYWSPDNVLAVCRGRSRRIGACCDTGHWVRSGLDPVKCLKKLEGRIVSFHLKDVNEVGHPEARDVPLGTGKANYEAVLAELHRQGFQGVMAIEYEHDSPELMDDMARCVAFVEKTARQILGQ